MNNDEKKKLYAALSAPFPEEAIERTKGSVTGKGYDTAGVRAQFLLNRVNEVCGVGSLRIHRTIEVRPITTAKGRTMYEATCDMTVELGEWVDGQWKVIAESISDGGHISSSMIDSKKGAHTGALKRGLAAFGVGKAAWEGKLNGAPDDDNLPADEVPFVQVQRISAVTPPAAVFAQPSGYVRSGPAVDTRPAQVPDRNRLSSKQLAAIMSISRKLGVEPSALRARVKTQFGCQLEFVSREVASQIIKSLDTQLNGNGHPAAEGEGLAS